MHALKMQTAYKFEVKDTWYLPVTMGAYVEYLSAQELKPEAYSQISLSYVSPISTIHVFFIQQPSL